MDPTTYVQSQQYPTGAPITCFADEYNPSTEGCNSYQLTSSGTFQLNAKEMVESGIGGAWSQDVWVYSKEEKVSADNEVPAPGDTLNIFPPDPEPEPGIVRIDGRKEWGGIIQVLNMGRIEPWISGKFEFKYFVNISNGTEIKAKAFGRWRRKNFEDQKWKNFDDFIGFWNISNWGPMHLERWIEKDGGDNITISSGFSPGGGYPSTNISTSVREDDDDLGKANVQFTDMALPEPGVTTYGISYMNFRRRTEP